MSKIYTSIISQLVELEPNILSNPSLSKKINLVNIKRENELRSSAKISDDYCIEINLSNNDKLDRIKFILETLKLEDELFIKFSSNNNVD